MKRNIVLAIMLLTSVVVMTGCQMLQETFGLEYRMIDNYFEQLEADLVYSVEKHVEENNITLTSNIALDTAIERLNKTKENYKDEVREFYAIKKAGVDNGTTIPELNEALINVRSQLTEELKECGITLETTEIKRSFWGSVWYFIRNHWVISLIIVGIIGSIPEAIANMTTSSSKSKKVDKEIEKMK